MTEIMPCLPHPITVTWLGSGLPPTPVLVNAFKRIQQRHIKQCRRYMECFTMKSGALSRGEHGQWPRATLYGSTFKDFLEVTAFPERHFPFQEIDRSTWIKSSGMRQWYITVLYLQIFIDSNFIRFG